MKVYTKKGDSGKTGLYMGGRVSKGDVQIDLNGDIDEAQAFIGLGRSNLLEDKFANDILIKIERDLWVMMAEVGRSKMAKSGPVENVDKVSPEMVKNLEAIIDEISSLFELPKEFVVPGESKRAAALDVARAVVRRAERNAVKSGFVESSENVVPYLNRLSDLLWSLARYVEGESLKTRQVNA